MDSLKNEPPTKAAQPKNRSLILTVGGMAILGMLALIGLVLFSGFPGPPQGNPDKAEAPPEDMSKAKP
jgi:hypothetical protein